MATFYGPLTGYTLDGGSTLSGSGTIPSGYCYYIVGADLGGTGDIQTFTVGGGSGTLKFGIFVAGTSWSVSSGFYLQFKSVPSTNNL